MNTVERVKKRIAEVLALDPANIDEQSKLIDDLGADSLDLVELMFLLEEEFQVRMNRTDMSVSGQLGLDEEQLHKEEVLTPLALELLRERFPHATDLFVEGAKRSDLAPLLTVSQVALSVEAKLAAEAVGPEAVGVSNA